MMRKYFVAALLAVLAAVFASPALGAGLVRCYVSDWPDHEWDDMEIEAVFDARPDRGSVRLVLTSGGQTRTVSPHDVDRERGYYVYEFEFVIPSGTWTPTLHWSSGGAQHSARQPEFTIR